jgi:hypothetical protein
MRTRNNLTGTDGFHVRNFRGGYFYFVQHVASLKHQIVIKYDFYDPNTKVSGLEIGAIGSNLSAANIRYNTLGFGYVNHINENIKLVCYYAKVWNEKTNLKGFTSDVNDDVITFRLQFRF